MRATGTNDPIQCVSECIVRDRCRHTISHAPEQWVLSRWCPIRVARPVPGRGSFKSRVFVLRATPASKRHIDTDGASCRGGVNGGQEVMHQRRGG